MIDCHVRHNIQKITHFLESPNKNIIKRIWTPNSLNIKDNDYHLRIHD